MTRLLVALALAVVARPMAGQTHLVVIVGIGGEDRYRDAFHQMALRLADAAVEELGVPRPNVVYLGERPEAAPDRIAGPSTKASILRVLGDVAGRAEPDAVVMIVLLGHGSETGGRPRINLPGPDLTAQDLAAALEAFPSQHLVVANLTSASGGWLAPLSGAGRVVVTATRSGAERQESHFAEHFVHAFAGEGADTDRNGRVSVLEAFAYAQQSVRSAYEREHRMLTEHAMLDDNGDGQGTIEPTTDAPDGAVAATLYLGGDGAAPTDPRLAALAAQRDSLERAVGALRARRGSMAADAYERELERLLLELARVSRALRDQPAGR